MHAALLREGVPAPVRLTRFRTLPVHPTYPSMPQDALAPVVAAALELAKIEEFTGRSAPSVIT